jgi:hypothetical protein
VGTTLDARPEAGAEGGVLSTLQAGQTLIVMKDMPCQRDSNRRHATIPDGQRIVIQKLEPVSVRFSELEPVSVRFSVTRAGQEETFTTLLSTIELCCADAKKPAVPKA